ncbi:PTS system mannose/fructose/sorbose family transporter subunit IID [Desulfonauticus submarinus]
MLKIKDLLQCFLRTYFIGSVFNTRGLQNIGLAYALDPALRVFYKEDLKSLRKARMRYLRKVYNCHPFWSPFLVGIFLSLEQKIIKKELELKDYQKFRPTIVYTFSAIGDSFFGGSLLPNWALFTSIFIVLGWYKAVFFVSLILFLGLQIFKIYTFILGYKKGVLALQTLGKWNLIDVGQYIKLINTGLILIFIDLNWIENIHFLWNFIFLYFIFGFVLLFKKFMKIRELILIFLFIFSCFLDKFLLS